jgi:AbrB family transcriptional regulator, transcriptional pleiotropic regulator of transition state genes
VKVKATGIVRRLDDLGRVVLPIELRRTMGLGDRVHLEIFTEGETVILRRYEPLCVFCGQSGQLVRYHGKQVCQTCRNQLGAPAAVT